MRQQLLLVASGEVVASLRWFFATNNNKKNNKDPSSSTTTTAPPLVEFTIDTFLVNPAATDTADDIDESVLRVAVRDKVSGARAGSRSRAFEREYPG